MSLVLVFIDGLGLGRETASNPLCSGTMPFFRDLLDGCPLTQETVGQGKTGPDWLIQPTDASLGVSGLPQSATGQTAFLTGVNAAQLAGRHIHGFPTRGLRQILNERSVFKALNEQGCNATFANTFTEEYFTMMTRGKIRHSATTTAALAGGCRLRMIPDLLRGEAVYQDITNQMLIEKGYQVPLLEPEAAARNLLKVAEINQFTLFEYFQTDRCGHAQDPVWAERILVCLDRLIGTLVAQRPESLTLVITSDHGNIEDLSVKTHTYNPIPTMAFGPQARCFQSVGTLTDLYFALLNALDVGHLSGLELS